MQAALRWTSLVLFSLVALFLVWFGITYATVTDMLWFHAAAVPETAREDVRTLYLALMNLIGASSAALGLLSLYVIAFPLRRNAPGAALALVGVNAIVFIMAAITAEELADATGAPTSWHIMGVLLGLTLAGLACHVVGTQPKSAWPRHVATLSLHPNSGHQRSPSAKRTLLVCHPGKEWLGKR